MFRIDLREIRDETSVESKRLDQESKRNAMEAKYNQNCLSFINDQMLQYIERHVEVKGFRKHTITWDKILL